MEYTMNIHRSFVKNFDLITIMISYVFLNFVLIYRESETIIFYGSHSKLWTNQESTYYSFQVGLRFMVFNATFNNISDIISWWSVLLVTETGIPRENHKFLFNQIRGFEERLTRNLLDYFKKSLEGIYNDFH